MLLSLLEYQAAPSAKEGLIIPRGPRLGYVSECVDREALGKCRTVKREREREKVKKGFLSK